MSMITLKAPCKINLSLDITSKRPDGYHELESVFQTLSIFDEVSVKSAEHGIKITSNIADIPTDESNTCFKAARLFFEKTSINSGAEIHIEKRIPSQAGLGGGSADAAYVLKALNFLHGLPLSKNELCEIGAKVGADVPFFIYGGTVYVSGIGEILKPISPINNVYFVIAKGENGISTVQAYKKFDLLENQTHTNTKKIVEYINCDDMENAAKLCVNSLESCADLSDIFKIKQIFKDCGAKLSLMSGSGSAVFGMFNSINDAEKAQKICKKQFAFAEVCTPFYDNTDK